MGNSVRAVGTFRICEVMARELDVDLAEARTHVDVMREGWRMFRADSVGALHGFLVGLRVGREEEKRKVT